MTTKNRARIQASPIQYPEVTENQALAFCRGHQRLKELKRTVYLLEKEMDAEESRIIEILKARKTPLVFKTCMLQLCAEIPQCRPNWLEWFRKLAFKLGLNPDVEEEKARDETRNNLRARDVIQAVIIRPS